MLTVKESIEAMRVLGGVGMSTAEAVRQFRLALDNFASFHSEEEPLEAPPVILPKCRLIRDD